MALSHFTDDNFEQEVVQSTLPVMIDFFATWCGPCQQLAPIVEELASDYEGKVKIGKLDVDQANVTASKFQVMSIPTIVFMKDGKVVDKAVGFMSKEALKEKLEAML